MKRNVILNSIIVLLVGLFAVTAGPASAQERHRNEIMIESLSWGISSGQVARIGVTNFVFADGSVRSIGPAIVRIQLLDTEGEVIEQSDEIRVEPGKTRFWDAPREILPAGDPNGRVQVRARILITTRSSDSDRNHTPFGASLEIFDPGTGRTISAIDNFANFQRFLAPPAPE